MRLRPVTSEVADQAKRPHMLPIESSPTKPAATAALTRDDAVGLAEEVLDHRRGLFQDADARRDVAEQGDPHQPELPGLDGVLGGDVRRGDQRLGLDLGGVEAVPASSRRPEP